MLNDPVQNAGVTLAAPVMLAFNAVNNLFGVGSSSRMSRSLGAKDYDAVAKSSAFGFYCSLFSGLLFSLLCFTFQDPLLGLLGADATTREATNGYMLWTVYLGSAPSILNVVMAYLVRAEGSAMHASIGTMSGCLLNIVLDPILIFALDMGTAGAALATALSQVVSFCILLTMCNTKADALSIRFSHFKPSLRIYGGICYNGIPSLGRQGIASISNILLNNAAGVYGDAAIAAMSIVCRYAMFINSSVIGFGQGFQPVCGFSYGAGKFGRVREAFWFCVKVVTVILVVLCVISLPFSGQIIALFRRDDPQVIEIGTFALRLQLLTLPLWGYITMCNMFTQAIGYGVRSTIISTARQGIFLIPALLIFPRVFGLLGIQISQPVADICTLALCIAMMNGILRQLKAREANAG